MMSNNAIQQPALGASYRDTRGKLIYTAFGVGMAINLASIYIGNPYVITLLMMPVAAVMTLIWLKQPVPWIVLVSVIAANPVNLNAPIALNLVFALFLLMLNMRYLGKLPYWLYPVLLFAFVSILGSVINWSTTGGIITQFAAISNYVVGPFLLIPLIYFRLQQVRDDDLLLKGFVFSLIVPTVTLMYIARLFGSPEVSSRYNAFEYLVNVSVYHLGNVEFHLTRTQAGIPIAALICASFAVIVSGASKKIRLIAVACLSITIFLLLVTGSIGSSLAALCGITLLLVAAWHYNSVKRYFIIFPVVIGFALTGWSLVPQGIKTYADTRYEERFSENTLDTSDRSVLWRQSFNYLLENPEGRGWDLYVAKIGTYPHNDYLSYGIAFGFLCSLLYFFVLAKILVSMVAPKKRIKDPAKVAILLAGIGVVTVLLIISFSDHLTANRWYFNVVWSIIWYCYFASKAVMRKD